MSTLQYYRPNHTALDGNSVLISGQCPEIKAVYLFEQLKQAAQKGCRTVIIDFGRTGDFSGILNSCGYPVQQTFTVGRDSYIPGDIPIREAVFKLRTHAQRLGYTHSDYAKMTAFLSFLMHLEQTSDRSTTLQQLLRRFNNQEKLEKMLLLLVRNREITIQEAEENIQRYLEYASSGITADTLLSELEFILNSENTNAFSLSRIGQGEAAVLYADENNSTDINQYMAQLWTSDLIGMADTAPLMIVINTGHYPQIDRMQELVETCSHKPNVKLFYSSYDLFSGVDTEKAQAFAKLFRYNLYGRHANDSAQKISNLFPEHWITQFNYTDARNQRILGENMLDRILGTDHTTTVSTSLVKESIIPAQNIANLTDRRFILFDVLNNTVQSMCI